MKLKAIGYFIILFFPILLGCTACDFVSYHPNALENTELIETRNHYIDKLEQLSSLESYYETEKRVYQLALIEGINQLNECESLDKLESIFNKNKEAILHIKTIDDYTKEADELRQDYIDQLKNISSEVNYLEEEKKIYLHYLNQGIEKLNQAKINELKGIFETYKAEIEKIKMKDDYILEWQSDFLKQVESHVDLADYRENEQKLIQELILIYQQKIKEATEFEQMKNIVRDFKTKVYEYETEDALYEKELQQLKQEAISEFEGYKTLGDYRNQEQIMIREYKESFDLVLKSISVKEEVATILSAYKALLDSLKTDKQYYQEEKQVLIEEGISSLKEIFTEEELAGKLDYFDTLYEQLNKLETKEAITESLLKEKEKLYIEQAEGGNLEALEIIKDLYCKRIDNYVDLNNYRVDEQELLKQLKEESKNKILQTDTYAEIVAFLKDCFDKIDSIKTNDELWLIEDEAFIINLQNKYRSCLKFPANLVQADSLFELADILDFYAFYQIDGHTFERDTFRVKVTFDYKDLQNLKRLLFYSCNLILNACTLDLNMENDSIVFQLTAHDFASKHHKTTPKENANSLSYYKNENNRIIRNEDFNDFAYYKNQNECIVWNSQQLWYAIEQKYIPIPIENSIADEILNATKQILREIITEDMDTTEKVYRIYVWCVEHFKDAWPFNPTIYDSASCFIEGALFDGVSLCQGISKLYILLLGLEGIESHLAWEVHNELNNLCHSWVYVKMEDGLFYQSAPFYGMQTVDGRMGMSFAYMLSPCCKYQSLTSSKYPLARAYHKIYQNIYYQNKMTFFTNKDELVELLDTINLNQEKGYIYIAYIGLGTDLTEFEELISSYSFSYYFPRKMYLPDEFENAIIYFD